MNDLVDAFWRRVPERWPVVRNRFVFRERNERNHSELPLAAVSQRYGVLAKRELEALEGRKLSTENDDLSSYKKIEPGDLVYNKMRMWQGAVGVSELTGIVSPAYVVAKAGENTSSRYMGYLLKSIPYIAQSSALSYGICDDQNSLRWEDFANLWTPAPPLLEQEAVANFLDEKTARIDALIAEKERLLVATKALFQSRVGNAVVHGVAERAGLIDVSEKGFASVRKDWALVPLKHLATTSGGMTPSKDNSAYWDGDIPWVSPKDMKVFTLHGSEDHVTDEALVATSLKLHPPNSVLVVVRGMILAHTFPVAINTVPVTVNQDMKVLRATAGVSFEYLAWLLRGLQPLMLSLTEESAHGTKALRTDQWANQPMPVPPLGEQTALVSLFQTWERDMVALTAHLEMHIERLREYRSALITAAVTGTLAIA